MGKADKSTGIGVIGSGNISDIYLTNLSTMFPGLKVVALAARDGDRVLAKAAGYPGVRPCTVDQLLSDPEVEVVVNLTVPLVHGSLGRAVLEAGKHLYQEKPLTVDLAEGEGLVKLAAHKGLRLGSAPDTVLGAGIQTCRKLIDDGWIGVPVGGSASMLCGGHEGWHPDPAFYYQTGGGPLFDMGPYYLTALVTLLGPVKSLSGGTRTTFSHRTIGSQPRRGEVIPVEVPTHVSALLEFEAGAAVTLTTSFDAAGGTAHAPIEIYGSEGTLQVPDPNTFGGPVRFRRRGAREWTDLPLLYGYEDNSRGLGVADLVEGLNRGTPHRADGVLALHVLEVMHGVHRSAESGTRYAVGHRCPRPGVSPPATAT